MSFEVKACPLCACEENAQIFVARDRHYGIPGLYRIVRCIGCSLVFLNPMYSDEELSKLYPNDYYAYQNNFKAKSWKDTARKILGYSIRTKDPSFEKPGKLLDLGCGSGWFMSEMRSLGWETYGVEISKSAAELGRTSAGLNIAIGTLEQAKFPSEFFDYVRSNHSFEHIARPNETLEEMYRILKQSGKLFIGVPNEQSLNSRLFGQYWWYRGAPVHPFTYSVETISRLLRNHGFQVTEITYNSDYTGILGSIQIWLNRNNFRKSTEGFVISRSSLRLLCHWIAKVIDLFRLGDAIEIVGIKTQK